MILPGLKLPVLLITWAVLCTAPAGADEALRLAASDLVAPDDAAATTRPAGVGTVRIAGALNGCFSGKVIAAASGPIEELKVVTSDLKNGGSVIPAAAVRIRFGTAWDGLTGFRRPAGLDILLDAPPPRQKAVAIWATVKVPKDAAPGDYKGTLTVSARGSPPAEVPVELHVAAWSLPDTQDYATWIELVQSPDTLSVEYGLPLWSEKHWRMIEQSFSLIGQTGSRVVYVPLICHANLGNAESMVRWIPKAGPGGGTYEFDFSVMERYLDAAEKNMGRPKIVVFNVWDVYQLGKSQAKGFLRNPLAEGDPNLHPENFPGHPVGPAVTVVDTAGKTLVRSLAPFSDPNGAALWAPLFAELRKRMARRGLEKTMMLGMYSDAAPTKEEAAALKSISGGLPWVCHAHFAPGVRVRGLPEAGYRTIHENVVLTLNPAKGRTYGWKESELRAVHPRGAELGPMLPSAARCLLEVQITGKQRGFGYAGGDVWWAIRDKRSQRVAPVIDRYPQSYWRNLEMRFGLLAPGADGPVASARYENVREGLEECEARIFLERALMDPASRAKLGEELAARAQALLDERQHALWKEKGLTDEEIRSVGSTVSWWRDLKFDGQTFGSRGLAGYQWFQSSGWQDRTRKLFDLASEAQRKLSAK